MSFLILASSSPRRQELLQQIGVSFQVQSADINEQPLAQEKAEDYVLRMAQEKAQMVAKKHPHKVVLAADTIVLLEQEILTKPRSSEDAVCMLTALSGHRHEVLTAVVARQGNESQYRLERTRVQFAKLSSELIAAYVATGEPLDKAGSYGIQGMGAVLVQSIEGCYSNVVGLPLNKTAELLAAFGVPIWQ